MNPDLTAAILARTSGPACHRLRGLACDLVDGVLAAEDAALALGHLDHCPACQGLVEGLNTAAAILPDFAAIDPGPAFTARVLARTRPAPVLLEDPLAAGWRRLLRRPRFCLEAAYLATAAGVMAFQIPVRGPAPALTQLLHRSEAAFAPAGPFQQGAQRIAQRGAGAGLQLEQSLARQGQGLWGSLLRVARTLWASLSRPFRSAWAIAFQPKNPHPASELSGSPRRSS